jgi:hypothetical protein
LFWVCIFIVSICTIISIAGRDIKPVLCSLALVGMVLLMKLIEVIADTGILEKIFYGIFLGLKFVVMNFKVVAIITLMVAVAYALFVLFRNNKK